VTNLENSSGPSLLTFSHSIEPMDADDWLKMVEKKLQVVECNNRERVLFIAHQLVRPVADWWDAYAEAHEDPETINWQEFKKEFEDLKQGSMTVSEYVT
jgi:hypothetical protein